MNHRLFVSVAALGLAVVSGFGQGTKVDYERAAEIRKRYSGKVYNESCLLYTSPSPRDS